MIKRAYLQVVKSRLLEPRKFIQAIMGPRQVGISVEEFLRMNPKDLF